MIPGSLEWQLAGTIAYLILFLAAGLLPLLF